MNPKKEFVNAIMSVLRLEQNIYTVAALEEIIDRIDTQDYTIFIAYLGERNADYEKPIQTIANAVDEFHKKKVMPKINSLISEVEKEIGFIDEVCQLEYTKILREDLVPWDSTTKTPIEKLNDFMLGKSEEWFTRLRLKNISNGKESKLNKEILDKNKITIRSIVLKETRDYKDEITRKYYQPSIIDKIDTSASIDADKALRIENKRTKSIIASAFKTDKDIIKWG